MHTIFSRALFLLCAVVCSLSSFSQQNQFTVDGHVRDANGNPIIGASVIIESINKGVSTDENGYFSLPLNGNAQAYTLNVISLGFKQKSILIDSNTTLNQSFDIVLEESSVDLSEVVVSGKSIVNQVKEKAFNVNVIDAKKLHNTTLDIAGALNRTSGIRVRESGGVGSDMKLSLNGFTGNQVRFFIDGIPMDNFGSSFQLNNIPIGLAERIEIYKGVVPIGLGGDALGGAINIITNTFKKSHLDASYSFGSFNTHRSMVNAIYVSKSGFTAQLNAYQNYSDNDYKIEVETADLQTGEYYPNEIVRRFHDRYHNETVIANIGVVNKTYADQLLFGITLGSNFKEIQTRARADSPPYGGLHRKGSIIMPSLKYIKNDFIVKGLNARINANINLGREQNIDTLHRRYNWLGEFIEYEGPGGERSYSLYKFKNNLGIATASFDYKFADKHALALSNTLNTFNRKGEDQLRPDNQDYEQPRKTMKNIIGLGYGYEADNWNVNVFTKHYFQQNKFSLALDSETPGELMYHKRTNTFNFLGYGLALTHFINDDLQIKASFEKSYRMPENEELYGDLINLEGNIDLKPEKSYNYNLGASYWWRFKNRQHLYFNINGFYRDASDFIRPVLNRNQVMQVMDNLGSVTNVGVESEIKYQFGNRFSAGVNLTYQSLRNNTKYEGGQTTESAVYRDRIPNMPYLYGNADMSYTFHDVGGVNNSLTIGYNMLYVHAFYLYWPSRGSAEGKYGVPEQIAQDLNLTYTWKNDLQFTLECRNIFNKNLYDNFSIQKPGRSFTGKIKYTFL